jgi:neutral trehalase
LAFDWKTSIKLFEKIKDPELRAWSFVIHSKWQTLLRKVNYEKLCQGCVSSHLKLKYPFVIPGGRFREFYYWDTYWILHGLLISEMVDTAKGVLLNFLDIVDSLGYVPNGSRIYYLNRSQPPMLTQMISLYINRTGDLSILHQALPLLDKEYLFWMHFRAVEIPSLEDGFKHVLNRYYVDTTHPRPESHLEDTYLAKDFDTDTQKLIFYKNVASAAESGWDFSSRWLRGPKCSTDNFVALKKVAKTKDQNLEEYLESLESFPTDALPSNSYALNWEFKEHSFHASPADLSDLRFLDIVNMIPLDLNCILFSNERILEGFHRNHGNSTVLANHYRDAYKRRLKSMKAFLHHPKSGRWADFNITSMKMRDLPFEASDGFFGSQDDRHSPFFYISDFSPIWYFDIPESLPSKGFSIKDLSIEEREELEFIDELKALKSTQLSMIQSLLFDEEGKLKIGMNFSETNATVGSKSGIWHYLGGIPTSEVVSGQQWDFPNAWAPFQYYLLKRY